MLDFSIMVLDSSWRGRVPSSGSGSEERRGALRSTVSTWPGYSSVIVQ